MHEVTLQGGTLVVNYKWTYNRYKRGTGVITPIDEVITLVITDWGTHLVPTCRYTDFC